MLGFVFVHNKLSILITRMHGGKQCRMKMVERGRNKVIEVEERMKERFRNVFHIKRSVYFLRVLHIVVICYLYFVLPSKVAAVSDFYLFVFNEFSRRFLSRRKATFVFTGFGVIDDRVYYKLKSG